MNRAGIDHGAYAQAPPLNPVSTAPASCGNGVVESSAREQREQGIASMTCARMLGDGATGLVMCINCTYDFTMCAAPMAATGAADTGTAAQAGTAI
jgi:hypothetical protein